MIRVIAAWIGHHYISKRINQVYSASPGCGLLHGALQATGWVGDQVKLRIGLVQHGRKVIGYRFVDQKGNQDSGLLAARGTVNLAQSGDL